MSLQRWSDSSVWARGQGWAVLDFTDAYEASKDPRYLEAVNRVADWYVDHAPLAWVPRYEHDGPDSAKFPYDSGAASIASSVLLRLAKWIPDRAERYQGSNNTALAFEQAKPQSFATTGYEFGCFPIS